MYFFENSKNVLSMKTNTLINRLSIILTKC